MFLKSTDNGETWAQPPTATVHDLNGVATRDFAKKVSIGGDSGTILYSFPVGSSGAARVVRSSFTPREA